MAQQTLPQDFKFTLLFHELCGSKFGCNEYFIFDKQSSIPSNLLALLCETMTDELRKFFELNDQKSFVDLVCEGYFKYGQDYRQRGLNIDNYDLIDVFTKEECEIVQSFIKSNNIDQSSPLSSVNDNASNFNNIDD